MAWINTPASDSLRDEFNEVAPGRDKASDGTIGDGEHASGVSDHNPDETGNTGGVEDADHINEVHARDVDRTGPWPAGWNMERFVQLILARCRSGAEKRLRYVIYNRRIWSASNGWREQDYNGANAHTEHAHFSFKYGSGSDPAKNPEMNTGPWGVVAAVRASQKPPEDEVSEADVINALNSNAGQAAIRKATYTGEGRTALQDAIIRANVNAVAPDLPPYSLGGAVGDNARRTDSLANRLIPELTDTVEAAVTRIVAAVGAAGGTVTPEALADGVEIALRRIFGGADR